MIRLGTDYSIAILDQVQRSKEYSKARVYISAPSNDLIGNWTLDFSIKYDGIAFEHIFKLKLSLGPCEIKELSLSRKTDLVTTTKPLDF